MKNCWGQKLLDFKFTIFMMGSIQLVHITKLCCIGRTFKSKPILNTVECPLSTLIETEEGVDSLVMIKI